MYIQVEQLKSQLLDVCRLSCSQQTEFEPLVRFPCLMQFGRGGIQSLVIHVSLVKQVCQLRS